MGRQIYKPDASVKEKTYITQEELKYLDPRYPPSIKNNNGTFKPPGFMGVFNKGFYQVYVGNQTNTFVVPPEAKFGDEVVIRVRVVGPGGAGGAGGGFAYKVIKSPDIAVGDSITIVMTSDSTTFGTFVSATGGETGLVNNLTVKGVGGNGIGGDYNAKGGDNNKWIMGDTDVYGHGGGAAGSQLGPGGDGGAFAGGTVNKSASTAIVEVAPGVWGYSNNSVSSTNITSGALSSPSKHIDFDKLPPGFPRFPFDGFYGEGGNQFHPPTGPGCGGCGSKTLKTNTDGTGAVAAAMSLTPGHVGGGGGGGCKFTYKVGEAAVPSVNKGSGGIGGGGGVNTYLAYENSAYIDKFFASPGGSGLIVIEW